MSAMSRRLSRPVEESLTRWGEPRESSADRRSPPVVPAGRGKKSSGLRRVNRPTISVPIATRCAFDLRGGLLAGFAPLQEAV